MNLNEIEHYFVESFTLRAEIAEAIGVENLAEKFRELAVLSAKKEQLLADIENNAFLTKLHDSEFIKKIQAWKPGEDFPT